MSGWWNYRTWCPAFCCAACGLTVALPLAAQVQPGSVAQGPFSTQRFQPAPGPRNFITTRGARSDGNWAYGFGLTASYARDAFVIESCQELAEGLNCSEVTVVENLASFDALLAVTPIPRLQLGLRLPITIVEGDGLVDGRADLLGGGVNAVGLGDTEFEVKARALGEATSPLVAGASASLLLPTGELTSAGNFIGDDGPGFALKAILDGDLGVFFFGANAGYLFREGQRIGASRLGNEAIYGVAAGVELGPIVRLMVDGFGWTRFRSDQGVNGFELDAALQVTPLGSALTFFAGGGSGVLRGIGAPRSRVILGVSYTREYEDRDEDGFQDRVDQCPTEAEDRDGFEDDDGCPDRDNDDDAIADDADRCPDQPEDVDGFEDTDGCPEPDNDQDGLPDISDRCPVEAENVNEWQDDDGCPDVPDRDRDGVLDDVDACPADAEDTDGFEDTDGCPERDNDGDGIPDDVDECSDTAEDLNGVDDQDGCPDAEDSAPATPKR